MKKITLIIRILILIIFTNIDSDYIKLNDINNIYNKKVKLYGKRDNIELTSIYYYKDAVLNELSSIKSLPDNLLDIKNIKIYTNLDVNVQKLLENNINTEMVDTSMQTAAIVIEPKNGKIKLSK